MKRTTLINIFSLFWVFAFAQNNPSQKLDMVFQSLYSAKEAIASKKSSIESVINQLPTPFKTEIAAPVNNNKSGNVFFKSIIYTTSPNSLIAAGISVQSVQPNFVTALITVDDIDKLLSLNSVIKVKAPRTLSTFNDINVANSGAAMLHSGKLGNVAYKGEGVLVGVFDTGIDWKHPDFKSESDQTKSRILRIWDQTLTAVSGESAPAGFSYGVEYSKTQIDDELDGTPAGFVREADYYAHGTHVAGTAAGNGMALASRKYMGMAPAADLIIVKGGDGYFSTANMVDAFTYFNNVATALNKPIVVNISIGDIATAHDGTSPEETAINNFSNSANGRVVAAAAGNDGNRNKHIYSNIATNGTTNFTFTLGNNTSAGDLFAFIAYQNNNNSMAAILTPPSGSPVNINPGSNIDVQVLSSSFRVRAINDIDPNNGKRYFDLYIERVTGSTRDCVGNWTLTFNNSNTGPVDLHGWLYYNNGAVSVNLVNADYNFLVSSPGNAEKAITVGSYVGQRTWFCEPCGTMYNFPTGNQDNISTFSSIGPRTDLVTKPEITASGQVVVSCLAQGVSVWPGYNVDGTYYIAKQGTSMSSPAVAGAIALLLQVDPSLSATRVKELLTSNARTDELTGTIPNNTWGYGKLDIFKAAGKLKNCTAPVVQNLHYEFDYSTSSIAYTIPVGEYTGVRFTSSEAGILGGIYFYTGTTISTLNVQVLASDQTTLLGTISITADKLSKTAWQYINLSNLNIPVAPGQDFYVFIGGASSNASIMYDNTNIDSRSFTASSIPGAFTGFNTGDFRIRAYTLNTSIPSNTPLTNISLTDFRSVSEQLFQHDCKLITSVVAGGSAPVTGNVSAKVWIDATQNATFVKRHYEITPENNAGSATGRVTLYFTQAEFDDFNAVNSSQLPTNPSDAAGIARMIIEKRSGTSSDGTGMPSTYPGSPINITQSTTNANWNVSWNSAMARWELSFDVIGFSGFWLKAQTAPLPIQWLSFDAQLDANNKAALSWHVKEAQIAKYMVERSKDGNTFQTIGSIQSKGDGNNTYTFNDDEVLSGVWLYRIKQISIDDSYSFSKIVSLRNGAGNSIVLWPNPASEELNISIKKPTNAVITTIAGQLVMKLSLLPGSGTYNISTLLPGMYLLKTSDNQVFKFLKK